MNGFVYVIQADNGEVKVGLSGSPIARLSKIKKDYGARRGFSGAYLVGYTATDRAQLTESYAHRALSQYAVGGEWFKLNALMALGIVADIALTLDDRAFVYAHGPEEMAPSKNEMRRLFKERLFNPASSQPPADRQRSTPS